jgi:alpha-L-fucosidase
MLGWPAGNEALIKKLATGNELGKVSRVSLLGNNKLSFEQTDSRP